MENSFKLRISKMFQSSFNSCRNKHISDVSDISDQPFFFPENRHHQQLIDLFSPKPHPYFSNQTYSDQKTRSPAKTFAGKYHSVSPSPQKNPKTAKKKKPQTRKPIRIHSFSSITDNFYYDCCSSDEEIEDGDTLFSSKSFSSESSVSFRKKKSKKTGKGNFVKDSVAIVKKSSDPYEDFRVSMVEMIVERQLFGVKDLENLLRCFISLNSEEYHKVIFEGFTEIWETVF